MPLIIKDKKQYLVSRVRSIIAQDHQITLDDLAQRLDREYGIKIERHYLSGIVRSLYGELYQALAPKLADLPFIVVGHLHVRGGIESKGAERRILVGRQHAVPHDVFPADASYVALGHLHKAQSIGSIGVIRYSGSLIPLSATEQPYRHGVTLVTIDGAAVTTEHIEIPRPVPFLSLGNNAAYDRLPAGILPSPVRFLNSCL